MASPDTMYRRAAARVDDGRSVRPFFTQPAGYMNRQDRRRAARAKRVALKKNRHVVPQPSAADTAFTESEAPT